MDPIVVTIQDIDDSVKEPQRIDDLLGMFKTVSSAPTDPPKRLIDQIKVYKNGATKRLYIYDITNNEWDLVTLT